MKAAVIERYGPPEVIRIKEVPKPVPVDNEVLVRVHATTVNSGDARVRGLRVPRGTTLMMRLTIGWNKPKFHIMGFDAAGVVEAVGKDVTRFKPGDRVIASRGFDFGCHAEYVTVPEDGSIVAPPQNFSDEQAVALMFGGLTALNFFRPSNPRPGEHILINGASGAVGVMTVQVAKHLGLEVTGVCSGRNADLVKSLGADHVIDYMKEDFTKGSQRYDLIMDTHGNVPYAKVKHLLNPGGRFLMVIGDLWQMMSSAWQKPVINADDNKDAFSSDRLERIVELAEAGAIKPVIGATFPFEEIAEAHRLVDTGHKVGSVVVTLPH